MTRLIKESVDTWDEDLWQVLSELGDAITLGDDLKLIRDEIVREYGNIGRDEIIDIISNSDAFAPGTSFHSITEIDRAMRKAGASDLVSWKL